MSLKLVSMEKQITDPWGRQSLTQTVATSSLETSQETLVDTCANNWERAIRTNNFNDLQQLLASEPHSINRLGTLGMSPLLYAIREAKTKMVHKLLAHKDTDIELPDQFGTTPLTAAVYGNSHMVRLLLKYGANRLSAHEDGTIPLMLALRTTGRFETVKYLLCIRNCSTWIRNHQWLARDNNGRTTLEYLIDTVDVNPTTEKYFALAAESLSRSSTRVQEHLFKLLSQSPVQTQRSFMVELLQVQRKTPMHFYTRLARKSNDTVLRELIMYERTIRYTPKTYLEQLIKEENTYGVQQLTMETSELNHTSALGMPPVLYAQRISERPLLMLKILAEKGASLTLPDTWGLTPLHVATIVNDLDTWRFLRERGVTQNAYRMTGDTPLMISILAESYDIFDQLQQIIPLDEWRIARKDGKTALDLLVLSKNRQLQSIFEGGST